MRSCCPKSQSWRASSISCVEPTQIQIEGKKILGDAFGNAIGNSIAGNIEQRRAIKDAENDYSVLRERGYSHQEALEIVSPYRSYGSAEQPPPLYGEPDSPYVTPITDDSSTIKFAGPIEDGTAKGSPTPLPVESMGLRGPRSLAYLDGFGAVPSYSGELPSPYLPPGKDVRAIARAAAEYQGIPYELSAAILESENKPGASLFRKSGQAVERTFDTVADGVDATVGRGTLGRIGASADALFGSSKLDNLGNQSSGIANLTPKTIQEAAEWSSTKLGRDALPAGLDLGVDRSLAQVPGVSLKADLYNQAAIVRMLVDQTMGVSDYSGPISRAQAAEVAARYNAGENYASVAGRKYGQDTVNRIDRAVSGERPLYFYEVP